MSKIKSEEISASTDKNNSSTEKIEKSTLIKDTLVQEKEETCKELPVESEEVIVSGGDSICDNKSEESTGEMTAEHEQTGGSNENNCENVAPAEQNSAEPSSGENENVSDSSKKYDFL